jgi:hypothetical protein
MPEGLYAIGLLNLRNWWLAGGAVRNMVWRIAGKATSVR